ncbi:hypothetical protein ACH5RR_030924 [Cinchona calisaya]|uniref:Uncharacterized protein n=1 Tax=Cinchona calisaya TaxID=153742 RepID=A0ABD2YX73_9GENT
MDNLTGLGIWLIALNPTLRGDMRWELSQGVPLRIVIRARDVSSGWPFPKEIFLEINEFFEFGCLHQGPVEGDLELCSGKSNIFLRWETVFDGREEISYDSCGRKHLWERTFGGLTTIDLMDKVTDTVDVSWYLLIVVLTGVQDSVLNLDDLAYTCRQYAYECMHIEDIGGSRGEEKSSSRLE